MTRPVYRPAQDRQPRERHSVETTWDGSRWDVVWRQVGWIGGTGAFYALDENPAPTEPGSFAPLWREISCARVSAPAPAERPRGAKVVFLDEITGTGV